MFLFHFGSIKSPLPSAALSRAVNHFLTNDPYSGHVMSYFSTACEMQLKNSRKR